jgi:hypothetical protein
MFIEKLLDGAAIPAPSGGINLHVHSFIFCFPEELRL